MQACLRAGKNMVVGTTGWYGEIDSIRSLVEERGVGLVFGANFSYGVNLFFQIVRAAAPALAHGYYGHITERHHIHKKDAPSGTAVALQRVLEQATSAHVDITSEREGDVTGTHTIELASIGRPHRTEARGRVAPHLCRGRGTCRGVDRRQAGLLRLQRYLRTALIAGSTIFR